MRRTIVLLSAAALVLASCSSGTDEGQDAKPTGGPEASASATGSTGSPTASPTPELRTDWDVPPYSELVAMYDYDTSEPLNYEVIGKERQDGVTVYDITYKTSRHPVPAKLVIPSGQGPFPVVVYVPRDLVGFYLPDAIALAQEGYAGLAIPSPHLREPYSCYEQCDWDAQEDLKAWVGYVIELRRALDLLETLPEIDAERVGFAGHAEGGVVVGVIAGLEDRVDAYVLEAAGGYWTERSRILDERGYGPEGTEQLLSYQQAIAVINPVNYIGHNRGAAFFFQGAKGLSWNVSDANFQAHFEAAPEPKTLRWYPEYEGDIWLGCPHGGATCDPSTSVAVDHRAWLQEHV